MRALILSGVIVSGLSAILFGRQVATATVDLPQLSYVATAHQLGVVGYRDPAGAISPDGTRLAYTEGRFIRVVPIGGGVPVTLAAGEGQIRTLFWRTNDAIAAQDLGRWWLYQLDQEGRELLREDGRQLAAQAAGSTVACIVNRRLTVPCGAAPVKLDHDRDLYGPIAHSPDGNTIYLSSPNDRGMVELIAADLTTRRTRRLSNFNRDAYAPSVAADGTVVFKTQSYRTYLADVAFEGGATRQLTTFQSETPSYHPTRPLIAFTFGTWRRVVDDAKYPDIAQDIGVIDIAPAFRRGISYPVAKPTEVLEDSDSEDQAMTWSPNGKWIAYHTHKEMSDDVWLRPANGSQPDKRITFLGRGAEVGWPRWSPDGRTVLLNGARKSRGPRDADLASRGGSDGASVLYAIGVNQDDGRVSDDLREVKVEGINGEMGHGEWMPGSTSIVALAKEGPGRHVIFTVPVAGGRAAIVHRFESEHDFAGLGVSSDGRFVAFAAPAPDGYFQIFVKAVGAATPAVQLTTDRSHKTQPTFAPDNSRVAFTVWSYDAAFWSFKDR